MMVKVIHLHGNMMKHAGFLGFELEGGKWGYFKSKGYGFGWFWTVLDVTKDCYLKRFLKYCH